MQRLRARRHRIQHVRPRTTLPREFLVPERYRAVCPCFIYFSAAVTVLFGSLVLVAACFTLGRVLYGHSHFFMDSDALEAPDDVVARLIEQARAATISASEAPAKPAFTPAQVNAALTTKKTIIVDDDTVRQNGDFSRRQLQAFQDLVPGKVRGVTVFRMTEDHFFAQALSTYMVGEGAAGKWCKGLVVDDALIMNAGTHVALNTVPVIEPKIFVLYPVKVPATSSEPARLALNASDRAAMSDAGVPLIRIIEVDSAFGARKSLDNLTATIVVHIPDISALPVAETKDGRIVLAAMAIPVEQYRDDVLVQGLPSLAKSMAKVLRYGPSDRPKGSDFFSYWWRPWNFEAQNIKLFALGFISERKAADRKLRIHRLTSSAPSENPATATASKQSKLNQGSGKRQQQEPASPKKPD